MGGTGHFVRWVRRAGKSGRHRCTVGGPRWRVRRARALVRAHRPGGRTGVGIGLALVVLATVVATFARRLSVPAPSLLVVAGVLAGLVPGVPEVRVAPDVVSTVVLPPLLYAAAEE